MNSSSVTVRQHGVGLRCRPIGQQRSCCDDQLNPPSTRRQIGALFEIEDLGPQNLAGFSELQRAWHVIGESTVVSRFEALRSEATPLVGRGEELELLSRRWRQAT